MSSLRCEEQQLTVPFGHRPEETPAPATDVQIADGEIQSNWDEVHDNFDNMGLAPELLRGVFAYGYVFL